MKRITVLGNNSGRNAGDAAILGNMLRDISEVYPDVLFKITTTHPGFIHKHFGKFNIKTVPLLPWYGAIKNFGIPLAHAMLNTDLVLICDNILFDRKFYNPLFNNLSSIALVAPFCKRKNIPIVMYNCSIGPIDFPYGKKALQKVMDACDLVITRDVQTIELLEKLNMRHPETVCHADCALNTEPTSGQALEDIIKTEGLFTNPKGTVGFNVNAYIDNWSMTGTYTQEDFCRTVGQSIDRVIDKLDVDILFVCTQPMDLDNTYRCIKFSEHKDRIKVVSNKTYTYEDLTGLLDRVEMHVGLRTHTLIFSAAMHTPMMNISSYPKSTGFMRTIGQEDKFISFDNLDPDHILGQILEVWNDRENISQELIPLVTEEKRKARDSAKLLAKYLS
jgi:polysaccharide pyruvyl transferase WcaK-like protein